MGVTCGLGIDWGHFGLDLGARGVDIGHFEIDLSGLHRGFASAIVGLTWGLRVQNERFGKRVDAE